LLVIALRFEVNSTNSALFEALGIFFGTLALVAAAVSINQSLAKPFISDVGGLAAGAFIAAGAAVLWALLKRRK
jgi:hypothetical protein